MSVDELARRGRIVVIDADPEAARERLTIARRHLRTAALAMDAGDPDAALAVLYDAARKAVTAHMLASGYRVRSGRPGAHEAVALYASAALGRGPHGDDVRALNRMRRDRNRSEYESWWAEGDELLADLDRARAIVAAVEAAWPSPVEPRE